MANHYHIVTLLDETNHGGSTAERYYGPGLPLQTAREDARKWAEERGFNQLAGVVLRDAESCDDFNTPNPYPCNYIMIDPCDNELDFNIPWHAYRGADWVFRRAPKGQPCSSLITEEGFPFFV